MPWLSGCWMLMRTRLPEARRPVTYIHGLSRRVRSSSPRPEWLMPGLTPMAPYIGVARRNPIECEATFRVRGGYAKYAPGQKPGLPA